MTKPTNEQIAQLLRGWCTDWNGAAMQRGEPPRDGLHCDLLLDAADALAARSSPDIADLAERLRKSADHDGLQEMKMVMRRIATEFGRRSDDAQEAAARHDVSVGELRGKIAHAIRIGVTVTESTDAIMEILSAAPPQPLNPSAKAAGGESEPIFPQPSAAPQAARPLLEALMKIAHYSPASTVQPVAIARQALVNAIGTWQSDALSRPE